MMMKTNRKPPQKPFLNFLKQQDRIAIGAILLFSVLIGIVSWYSNADSTSVQELGLGKSSSDRTPLQVRQFSWEGQQIGVQDKKFLFTFNRPVNPKKIAKHLEITPSLPGKISGKGRRIAYTLTKLPVYGKTYEIKLQGNLEGDTEGTSLETPIEPFLRRIRSRDRAFVYLGIEEEEQGRLILYNLTRQKKEILTPKDLVVMDFEPYPDGDRILFSAYPQNSRHSGLQEELYTVTTGLNFNSQETLQRPGIIEKILDAKKYQNLQFALSANGKTILIQRANHKNSADSSLWVLPEFGKARPLGIQSGEFTLSPDGKKVAVSQKDGVLLIPLSTEETVKVLSNYHRGIAFSPNNQGILAVKYHKNYSQSLHLVTDSEEKEIFKTNGSILNCEFNPRQPMNLYCLATELIVDGANSSEEPFLAGINLETETVIPLLALPNSRDVQLSMSSDGLALLFDQIVTTGNTKNSEAIATGRLWLLPLTEISEKEKFKRVPPQELLSGYYPRWIP
ncbi:MAG: hypothetical protein ACOC0N_00030 [Chroococcales cyanobacterium]